MNIKLVNFSLIPRRVCIIFMKSNCITYGISKVTSDTIKKRRPSTGIKKNFGYYYYPIEVEQSLINNIIIGDISKTLKIIDEVFEINFSNNILSHSQSKCLIYNLIGTVIKTLDKLGIMYDYTFSKKNNPIEELLDYKSIELLRVNMTNILKDICEFVQYNRNNNVLVLLDCIIEYVDNNYSNSNLGVSIIADEFNMNITYLSKFFKKQTGICLLDYINKIRIQNAKILITEHNLNIKEAAEKCGFFNCNSFIRVFKKYEGITPGQFKQIV